MLQEHLVEDVGDAIKHLTLCSFLEIKTPRHGYIPATDETKYKKYLKAAQNVASKTKTDVKFRIHRAFWPSLLIEN